MQAMVRLSDRLVLQTGTSLGELRDPDTDTVIPTALVTLTEAQETALREAFQTPHSRIFFSAAGAVTFDPPDPPTPPTPAELAAEQQFAADRVVLRDYITDAQLDAFLANAAPTAAAQLAALKGTIRALRALARATRYAISELKEEA